MSEQKQALPDWLPLEPWNGYIEMRNANKWKMTDRAVKLALALLESIHTRGGDVAAVLDQSTMNNWRGLFAVAERRSTDRQQSGRASFAALGKHGQATANNLQEWLEEGQ